MLWNLYLIIFSPSDTENKKNVYREKRVASTECDSVVHNFNWWPPSLLDDRCFDTRGLA